MTDQSDVRRIALSLPEASQDAKRFAFSVQRTGQDREFVWVWLERDRPGVPGIARPDVIAIRVTGLKGKEKLLAADPSKFFTEPHYDGFPAVLVRLACVSRPELEELITQAWRCRAPRALVAAFDRGRRPAELAEAARPTAEFPQSNGTS